MSQISGSYIFFWSNWSFTQFILFWSDWSIIRPQTSCISTEWHYLFLNHWGPVYSVLHEVPFYVLFTTYPLSYRAYWTPPVFGCSFLYFLLPCNFGWLIIPTSSQSVSFSRSFVQIKISRSPRINFSRTPDTFSIYKHLSINKETR